MGEALTEPDPWWSYKPPGEWTFEDLHVIPYHHIDLIDGVPHVMVTSPYHDRVVDRLLRILEDLAPADAVVMREKSVRMRRNSGRNRPEPDVLIINADAFSLRRSVYDPTDVLLAVEVVSPESTERDRVIKPALYADSGIPHLWRIEESPDERPVVYAYELVEGSYGNERVFADRVEVNAPFRIGFDITAITP
ncbi:hypothetical protein GCM10012275_12470 [Longimycelium tulufanense]|uniref:Putative restriction endonuclease domain-containing protein n=1 Tax=Longimycelium tulufanense TaxID=907463 RepID=A0A8J3C6R4_9PSEU|nr:Uma2 family endonuclease [Longimycelium tulufanense]GGM43018.1 hypothetical protein GCM10012275_12470 [Longimycelium tulufanense]